MAQPCYLQLWPFHQTELKQQEWMVEEKVRFRGKCKEETRENLERKSLSTRREDDPGEGRKWASGKGAALQEETTEALQDGKTDLYRNGESDWPLSLSGPFS